MKYIVAFLLIFGGCAWASEVKIISYGPKSGNTTALGILLSKEMAANPTVIATGDCQESARQFDAQPSAIGLIGHPSVLKGQTTGKNCPMPFDQKVLFVTKSYYSVCHMKTHTGRITENSRISVPGVFPYKKFIGEFNQDNQTKLRVINIAGAGEAMASLLSGDVEFTLLPHFGAVQSVADGKIVCSSLDSKDPSYLGKQYNIRSEPFYGLIFIITKGLSGEQNHEIVKALRSPGVQNYLNANAFKEPTVEPTGKDLEIIKKIFEDHRQLYLE